MNEESATKQLDIDRLVCRVVQKHPLIYDRSHVNYHNREAFDEAWLDVAKNCQQSVSSCKSSWKHMRNQFEASLKEARKRSKGSESTKYHLDDLLDFLKPYLHLDETTYEKRQKARRRWRSGPISNNKTNEKAEVKSASGSDVEGREKKDVNIKAPQEKEKEIEHINVEQTYNCEDMINEAEDESQTKPPSPRCKEEKSEIKENNEKEKKRGKEHKLNESPTKNIAEPVQNKLPDNIDNTADESRNSAKANNTPQTTPSKKNLSSFIISPKNDGNFFIKNKNDQIKDKLERESHPEAYRELADKKETSEKSKNDSKHEDTEDFDDDIPLKQISERSTRLKRACKRGLGKTMIDKIDDNEKEPEVKRSRRCAERLKSMVQSRQEVGKLLEVSKQEIKPVKSKDLEAPRRKIRSLIAPQLVVDLEAELETTPTANSTPKNLSAPKPPTHHSQLRHIVDAATLATRRHMIGRSTQTNPVTFEPKKVETGVVGIQCDLLKAESTDDFLSTLRPYLNDMNARQKLHFKKKIFESLMEVFDSGSDFPARKKLKLTEEKAAAAVPATSILPPQLKDAVSGEELSLVRELVAMVQAAKRTPELMVNNNSKQSSEDSFDSVEFVEDEKKESEFSPAVTATTSKPPPLSRVIPTNMSFPGKSVSSAELPPCLQPRVSTGQQIPTSLQSSATTSSTPLATVSSVAPISKGGTIRKLIKVDGFRSQEGDRRRRFYRIVPRSGTTKTNIINASTASGGDESSKDIEMIIPQSSIDTKSVGSGRAESVKAASSDNAPSVSGSAENILSSSSQVTPAGLRLIQRIRSNIANNRSGGPGGTQKILLPSNDTIATGTELVKRFQPSVTNNMPGVSGSGQILKTAPTVAAPSCGFRTVQTRNINTTPGRIQFYKTNVINNTKVYTPLHSDVTPGGSGRLQVFSPREISNKLNQTATPSNNTTPTSTGSKVERLRTPETSTAPTSTNNAAPSTSVPPITTNPRILNIRHNATASSNRTSTATTASSMTTTQTSTPREVTTPISTVGSSSPGAVAASLGARPLARRYSVCGSVPTSIAANDRTASPNNILTTTANDQLVSSLTKVSAVSRNFPASQKNKKHFKLPTKLNSTNAATSSTTATTRTVTFIGKPLVNTSTPTNNNNSSARPMPVLVGFNQSVDPASSTNSNATGELPKGLSLRSYYSTISSMTSGSDNDAAETRFDTAIEMSSADFEGMDFSELIGNDNFDVVTIKNEPIDSDEA